MEFLEAGVNDIKRFGESLNFSKLRNKMVCSDAWTCSKMQNNDNAYFWKTKTYFKTEYWIQISSAGYLSFEISSKNVL